MDESHHQSFFYFITHAKIVLMKTLKTKMKLIENLCAIAMLILTWIISAFSFVRGENWTALLISPERPLLLIFGPVGALLFCFLLYRLSIYSRHPQKKLCLFTCLCMPLSLMFMFDPLSHPLQSNLHLFFSYLYFYGVNFSLITSLFYLHFTEPKLFKTVLQAYLLILGIVLAMYLHYTSVNTLFEVTFTSAMTILVIVTIRKLN